MTYGSAPADGLVGGLVARYGFTPGTNDDAAGVVDGFPVNVMPIRGDGGEKQVAVVVTTGDATMSQIVVDELTRNRDQAPAKARKTDHDGDVIFSVYPARALDKLPGGGVEVVEHLVTRAGTVAGARPVRRDGARLTVVDGAARYLTDRDRDDLLRAGEQAEAAYAALRPNLARGALFGLGGIAIGTAAWAIVAAYLGYQAFLVAIGAGVLIAWLVVVGARRTSPAVQGIIALETLAAVALGELLAFTLIIQREFGVFDPVGATQFYFEIIGELAGDLAFAVAGGAVGAFVGIRKASRPQLAPQVQQVA